MARIFTDEELEREIARHVLIFAEQSRRNALDALDDPDIHAKLGANGFVLLKALLNTSHGVNLAVARHRCSRAGMSATEIDRCLAEVARHRPFGRPAPEPRMRPLGPTNGVPTVVEPLPALAEVTIERSVVQMGDLPEPDARPLTVPDDSRPLSL